MLRGVFLCGGLRGGLGAVDTHRYYCVHAVADLISDRVTILSTASSDISHQPLKGSR